MDKYEVVKKLISGHASVNFAPFGKGTTDAWITKAQNRLKVTFPPSYVWWLKNYKAGEIYGDEIFGIYETEYYDIPSGDIVYRNELKRKRGFFNSDELYIQSTDFGEWYYLDLTQVDENGEHPVYDKSKNRKYANDFLDFLKKKLEGK